MTPQEAADRLRPTFHLESMPPEDRHHVKFVEDVATELGVEHTAFNLHQVASALDEANIHEDANDYPKMKFSRQHHAQEGVAASVYDPRHDYVWVKVESEEQEHELGSGWVDNVADLPERGETPIDAPVEPPHEVETHNWDHQGNLVPKSAPDGEHDKLTGVGAGNVGVAQPKDAVSHRPA